MRSPGLLLLVLIGVTACTSETEGEPLSESEEEIAAPTCAPSIAAGAVPGKHRAMLDMIASAEGTLGSCGQDGYSTGFGFNCFSSCVRHPNRTWTGFALTSSAAGRYQFLRGTWAGLGLASFSPKNQDIGAMKLVRGRNVSLPTDRALTSTEFTNAMRKLSYEWASLPFSPYGQPTISLATARDRYCRYAGC